MKYKILLLDDEINNVEALERIFRKNLDVLKATTAQNAIEILDQNPDIALIITDQKMPHMTGTEFLKKSISTHPETIRILLTGYSDIEDIIDAVNEGSIYRYINKPWDIYDLEKTVFEAIEKYKLARELKQKNFELIKALEELKALDQAKSKFMILINHELKTPLTSILSFSDILFETELNEDQKKYLQRIQISSQRLKEIIDDVLFVVKAESRAIEINKSIVDLKEFSKEFVAKMQIYLAKRNQVLQISSQIASINTDLKLLEQVLTRLVLNAIQHGESDSAIRIEIKKLNKTKNVHFNIDNKGTKLSNELIGNLNQRFYVDQDILNHSKGMGLGLSICYSILENLDSKLEAKNTDEGVHFSFMLKDS